jgi:hypothetical protein
LDRAATGIGIKESLPAQNPANELSVVTLQLLFSDGKFLFHKFVLSAATVSNSLESKNGHFGTFNKEPSFY